MSDSRVVAVQAMQALLVQGRSFNTVLEDAETRVPQEARARLRAVCFEWARWATQIAAVVDAHLDKPLRNKDKDVYLLMQLGVLEIMHMGLPAHTAVNECVKTLKGLKKPWAKGLVNAVLRNTQRNPVDVASLPLHERYAYPAWWVNRISDDWPNDVEKILCAGNQRAPMTLRVNTQKTNIEAVLKSLSASGNQAAEHIYADTAVTLAQPASVTDIPGFSEGLCSVQDAAAQLLIPLLRTAGVAPTRVLDACAAPGGKTGHLLESFASAEVLALDSAEDRLSRVTENLSRLGLTERANCKAIDACDVGAWWDGKPFDLVLLDAPCTGSGVIRRHPDIKHTRWEEDITSLAQAQLLLMQSLWPTVASGGYMVYATCSILAAENTQSVLSFLSMCDDASDATPEGMPWGKQTELGYQVFPGEHGMDGFYYALLHKRADA